jgi:hypothetical protein
VLHKFYSLGNIGKNKLRRKKFAVCVAHMGEKLRQENLKKWDLFENPDLRWEVDVRMDTTVELTDMAQTQNC